MTTSKSNIERLAFGTVQLGKSYGIANDSGVPDNNKASGMLHDAFNRGVIFYDTAQNYGSEKVIGEVFSGESYSNVKIISKYHPECDDSSIDVVMGKVAESLKVLGRDSIYGFLAHDPYVLKSSKSSLIEGLAEAKRQGMVQKVGVSLYSPEEALRAADHTAVDMIQLPFNLFDKKMATGDFINMLKEKGVEVFIRSVFLQGLILMDIEKIPERMSFAVFHRELLDKFCQEKGLNKAEFALSFAFRRTGEAKVVIGMETAEQLKENLDKIEKLPDHGDLYDEWLRLMPEPDDKLLDPSRW